MSLTCEISGEALATTQDEVVVTPSGHVCLKRLLLGKLAETGGMDPFVLQDNVNNGGSSNTSRPLTEDQLITLQGMGSGGSESPSSRLAPPRPQVTSLPNLLQTVQSEYDTLVLELFDTRKALEETRRELSQALYQNDAAVRVVARLSMERDAARQQVEEWNASARGGEATEASLSRTKATTSTTSAKRSAQESSDAAATEASTTNKKRKLTAAATDETKDTINSLPEADFNQMVEAWEGLHKQRKAMQKAAAELAPTPETLATYQAIDEKACHKSTCRSLLDMSRCTNADNNSCHIVTTGKDKQVVVYDTASQVVLHTFTTKVVATCVDVMTNTDDSTTLVVTGNAKGQIHLFVGGSKDAKGVVYEDVDKSPICQVQLHPTGNHVCATTERGSVLVLRIKEQEALEWIGEFSNKGAAGDNEDSSYTAGALHPDGLLYAAGTKKGAMHVWDFKNKALAVTFEDGEDAIVQIAFSNNGYHLASSHQSGAVKFWDLRKNKLLATMNADKSLLKTVTAIAYDDSAKYVAFGGDGGVQITTVKEWGTTASFDTKKPVSGIIWNKSTVVVCSDKERQVRFFDAPSKAT